MSEIEKLFNIFDMKLFCLKMKKIILAIWNFYLEGFKNMTWGKQLWILIFLKVIILFLVLRLFFFKPIMAGKTDEQKSEYVGIQLSTPKLKTEN